MLAATDRHSPPDDCINTDYHRRLLIEPLFLPPSHLSPLSDREQRDSHGEAHAMRETRHFRWKGASQQCHLIERAGGAGAGAAAPQSWAIHPLLVLSGFVRHGGASSHTTCQGRGGLHPLFSPLTSCQLDQVRSHLRKERAERVFVTRFKAFNGF